MIGLWYGISINGYHITSLGVPDRLWFCKAKSPVSWRRRFLLEQRYQRFAINQICSIFRFMNKAVTDNFHASPTASQAYVNIAVSSVSNITCGMVCIVNSSFRYSGSCVRILLYHSCFKPIPQAYRSAWKSQPCAMCFDFHVPLGNSMRLYGKSILSLVMLSGR